MCNAVPKRSMASWFQTRILESEMLKLFRTGSCRTGSGIAVNRAPENVRVSKVLSDSSKAASSIVSIGLPSNDISVMFAGSLPADTLLI